MLAAGLVSVGRTGTASKNTIKPKRPIARIQETLAPTARELPLTTRWRGLASDTSRAAAISSLGLRALRPRIVDSSNAESITVNAGARQEVPARDPIPRLAPFYHFRLSKSIRLKVEG